MASMLFNTVWEKKKKSVIQLLLNNTFLKYHQIQNSFYFNLSTIHVVAIPQPPSGTQTMQRKAIKCWNDQFMLVLHIFGINSPNFLTITVPQ
jgi:hypothetical protein